MSVQPIEPQPEHGVIRVGASEAVVIPMDDYLRLRAIERHTSALLAGTNLRYAGPVPASDCRDLLAVPASARTVVDH